MGGYYEWQRSRLFPRLDVMWEWSQPFTQTGLRPWRRQQSGAVWGGSVYEIGHPVLSVIFQVESLRSQQDDRRGCQGVYKWSADGLLFSLSACQVRCALAHRPAIYKCSSHDRLCDWVPSVANCSLTFVDPDHHEPQTDACWAHGHSCLLLLRWDWHTA